eukprot:18378-Pelagomonas_calceolata.AAC.1
MTCLHPMQGVRQGCPLSHLLSPLYVNDVDSNAEDVRGSVTGTEDVRATYILLSIHARKKHLIINTVKSEVVHFNSKGNTFPVFTVGNDTLAHKDSFKYLGMIFTGPWTRLNQQERHLALCLHLLIGFVVLYKRTLVDRPHASLWSAKTYVVAAGLYTSQIWGTGALGVKLPPTGLLRENVGTNYCSIRIIGQSCTQAAVRSGGAISMNNSNAELRYRLQGVWREADSESVDPRGNNNKLAIYQSRCDQRGTQDKKHAMILCSCVPSRTQRENTVCFFKRTFVHLFSDFPVLWVVRVHCSGAMRVYGMFCVPRTDMPSMAAANFGTSSQPWLDAARGIGRNHVCMHAAANFGTSSKPCLDAARGIGRNYVCMQP